MAFVCHPGEQEQQLAMVDPDRFDELAIAAATEPVSRGRVLKMLAAAVLGGGDLLMSADAAEAAC